MRAAALLLFAISLTAAEPTPEQLRGRNIYLQGASDSGRELVAVTGRDQVQIPATALPCAGCHGYDGRGKPEGGVKPADISGDSLRRPSDGARTNGRERPAYDDATLTRAIAMGIDSGRNTLDATMPRYRMPREDMRDLLAYLQLLGDERDPGLTGDAIEIGVIGTAAAREPLEALAARANEDGIYGRKLHFRFAESFSGGGQPFLIIDTTPSGDATIALAEKQRIPAIVATSSTAPAGRYAFQLLGGTREAALALLAHAREATPGKGLLILHDRPHATLAASIKDAAKEWNVRLHDGAWTADLLRDRAAVLILGNPGTVLDRIAAASLALIPADVIDGALPPIPPALDGKVIVAFPAIPSAEAPRMIALASAAVLLNAFETLGRDLTRERVVEHLQTLRAFDSGWLPPLTWTPTRRTGTTGAYLMTAQRAEGRLVGRPGWVEGR